MSQITKTITISPALLEVEDGFNIREAVLGKEAYKLPDVRRQIVAIKHAYKNGLKVDLIKVIKRDSRYLVRQGHCRFYALMEAIDEMAEVPEITVILMDEATEEDEDLENLTGNRGIPLNAVANAAGLKVMMEKHNWTTKKLAQTFNTSEVTIRTTLQINDLPNQVKSMIISNVISKTMALQKFNSLKGQPNADMRLVAEIESIVTSQKVNSSSTESPSNAVQKNKPISTVQQDNSDNELSSSTVPGMHKATKRTNAKVTAKSFGIKKLSRQQRDRLQDQFLDLANGIERSISDEKDSGYVVLSIPRSQVEEILKMRSLILETTTTDKSA